jgi:hypothetical protein
MKGQEETIASGIPLLGMVVIIVLIILIAMKILGGG